MPLGWVVCVVLLVIGSVFLARAVARLARNQNELLLRVVEQNRRLELQDAHLASLQHDIHELDNQLRVTRDALFLYESDRRRLARVETIYDEMIDRAPDGPKPEQNEREKPTSFERILKDDPEDPV